VPPIAYPPGRESITTIANHFTYAVPRLAAQAGVPHPADDVALVEDDVGLPNDGPKHETHGRGSHGKRHSELRFTRRHAKTAKESEHLYSPGAHIQVESDGLYVPSGERWMDYQVAALCEYNGK
jgi:hypothetical protein